MADVEMDQGQSTGSGSRRVVFDLPEINGDYEVGIAVGVDPSLPDDEKLPILANTTINTAAGYAAAWAWNSFADKQPEMRALCASAAAGIVFAGFANRTPTKNDGDWRLIEVPDPMIQERAPDNVVTLGPVLSALSLVVSTKANMFLINHHTGHGVAQGYVKKLLKVQHPDWRENDPAVVSTVHLIGHLASTIGIFSMAGLRGPKALSSPLYEATPKTPRCMVVAADFL